MTVITIILISLCSLLVAPVPSPDFEVEKGCKRYPSKVRDQEESSSAVDGVEHCNSGTNAPPQCYNINEGLQELK